MGVDFIFFISWLIGLIAFNIWGYLINRRFSWYAFVLAPFLPLFIMFLAFAILEIVLEIIRGEFNLMESVILIITIPLLGFGILFSIAMFHEIAAEDD